MYKKILLAYDGSEHAAAALRHSSELARLCNAELHLLGVVVISGSIVVTGAYGAADFFGQEEAAIDAALKAAVDDLGGQLSVHTRIRTGDPAVQIAAHAHEIGADLAVIGHSDKGFVAWLFEGSTGAKLIRDLPCNLLVVTAS